MPNVQSPLPGAKDKQEQSGQIVELQFFSKRAPVNTQTGGSTTLVSIALVHYRPIQRLFNLTHNQLMQIAGFLTVQDFKISAQLFFHLLLQR